MERPERLDEGFWERLIADDYALPDGYSRSTLTRELLSYLGLPDSQLRETVAYTVLDAWIHRDCYSQSEFVELVDTLLHNLTVGLGETGGDSIFLRSYSLLILTEIIYHGLKRPALSPGEVRRVLEQTLSYFLAEQDLRDYDLQKGWIHAVAHAADLFFVLAQHVELGRTDLSRILTAIATKVAAPVAYVYLYDEETRLVRAVMAVLQRDLLSVDDLSDWLQLLSEPPERIAWNESFEGSEGGLMMEVVRSYGETCARHNCRLFLYSLYLQLQSPGFAELTFVEQSPRLAGDVLPRVRVALEHIRAWC